MAGAAAGLAAAAVSGPASGALRVSLKAAARSSGRYFGAAVRMDQIEAEPALRRAVLEDCDSLTPEIHLKWDCLQPERGVWTPREADRLVNFARANDLSVRGHSLLWDQSTPAWARRAVAEEGWEVVEDHFSAVLGRYAEHVDEWDVVNEPIDTESGRDGLRRTTFHQAFGPEYVDRALRTAREFAPRARLMINEYSLEYDNPVDEARRTALLKLVERLRAAGAPLDGIGLQAHLDLSKGPLRSDILDPFLRNLADLGVFIAVTELDVTEADRRAPLLQRDQQVADEVRRYLDIVLDHPAVRGVTTWGLSDRHSWLLTTESPDNRGLPFDAAFQPKPMLEALTSAMRV